MNLTIRQKLRASHVKRWHIVETSKRQSVAEHSFNVILFAQHIAQLEGIDPTSLVLYAVQHDLDEVVTGDVPTPVKIAVTGRKLTVANRVAELVKIADYLDAIHFLAMYGIGAHAKLVRNELVATVGLYTSVAGVSDRTMAFVSDVTTWETEQDKMEGVAWHEKV